MPHFHSCQFDCFTDEGSPTSYIVLFWFDLSVLIFFSFEYFLRIWASTVLPKFSGPYGLWKIIFHPIYIIDATVIGLTIACMVLDVHMQQLSAGLRGFRMLNIFENRSVKRLVQIIGR